MVSFLGWFSFVLLNIVQNTTIMTFLIFSQISFQTTTKTSHFSLNLFFFPLALHVSALRPWSHAVAYYTKTKGAGPNFTFTSESESKIRTNRSLQKSSLGKNWSLRGDPAPSPTVPLLQCPHGPPQPEICLLLCRQFTPSNNQGREGSAHVGAPGSTPSVEDGDGWQRNEDPPRCRYSLLVRRLWWTDDGAPPLLRLAGLEYRSGANALALLTYSSLYGYWEGGGVKGALRFPKSNYSTVVLLWMTVNSLAECRCRAPPGPRQLQQKFSIPRKKNFSPKAAL